MLGLYNALLLLPRALAALGSSVASMRDAGAERAWAERLARVVPRARPGGVWIHGASVGEAHLVSLLASSLARRVPDLPVSVSAVSPTGRARLPEPPAVDAAFFAPLDFRGLPGRVLDALAPRALVLVETEIWPNLLQEAAERGIPSAIVNARLSPARMSRYRRLRSLYAPLLGGVARIGAQGPGEVARFVAAGARPSAVEATGNLKYDLPAPVVDAASLRARFGLAPGRPVVVAGSTGPGEERLVAEAFLLARGRHPSLFLVLAPRHPSRADEADGEARRRGLSLARLTSGARDAGGSSDGILVDTIGDLASLYSLASAAFVGGSLVPVGGHNLLEPAAAGVPVLFGPHTHHVADLAADVLSSGAGVRVASARALGEAWADLVGDRPRRDALALAAASLVRDHRGALDRTVDLVLSGAGRA